MHKSFKPLRNQIIVITGASSGIGLATAQAAAAQGAKVVLAARDGEALREIEQQINSAGGQAIHVVADVSQRNEVQRIADMAIQRFGGFDTWVNNAGLSIWGRLEEVSDEDSRQMFEINFWGIVYGSLIASAHLKRRGGTLINVGSVASDAALPLQGMYSASKHAVKGFTDALRMELEEEGAPVSVTLIKPAGINTPFPQHAKNYTNKAAKLPPPVYEPEEVATAILHAATHAERDIYVGGGGKMMSTLNKHAPRVMDWMAKNVMLKQELRSEPPRNRAGSLYTPANNGKVHGDQPGYVMKNSLYTRASTHPLATTAIMAAVGFAAATWLGVFRKE